MACRLPAEWEPHEATWLCWPHRSSDWPGKFASIRWVYVEIIRRILQGERVRLLVQNERLETEARRCLSRAGVDSGGVDFLHMETNRGWLRDSGPCVVEDSAAGRAVVGFGFTGWAKYPDWVLDARIPERAAGWLGLPLSRPQWKAGPAVLEGGAIEVNGRGTIIVSEECLLDPAVQVRNPGMGKAQYEALFAEWLGASNAIWLGRGVAGDDTHGHVDDFCRFVDARTLVLCRPDNPGDPNYRAMQENRERLQDAVLEDGSRAEIVDLPMPQPLFFDGWPLPASYANYAVCNAGLLVPTFNDPADCRALGLLAELTGRPAYGVYAGDLILGYGAIHCLCMQEPLCNCA